jgi:hypothetical protein
MLTMGVVDVKSTRMCSARGRRWIGDNDVTHPGMRIDLFTIEDAGNIKADPQQQLQMGFCFHGFEACTVGARCPSHIADDPSLPGERSLAESVSQSRLHRFVASVLITK